MSTPVIARAHDTVRRIAGHGPHDLADASRRLAALKAVSHPGVVVPIEIDTGDGGAVIVTMPRVRGDDLGVVRRLRGGLSVGECVAVGIDVAEALAALHEAGLAHGDVSPANVIVTGTRAMLVDTLAGASRTERGTAGFAAPERVVSATPACDMYALGRLLEYLADDAGRERVHAWASPMCAAAPAERPTAVEVAQALRACAEPTPVAVPSSSVAAMVRARALPPEEETLRTVRGRPWRIRKGVIRVAAGGAATLGMVAAISAVVSALGALSAEPESPAALTIPRSSHEIAAPPDVAAATLVRQRIEALATADAEALLATTSATGSARVGDVALAERLAAGQVRYESLAVDVTAMEAIAADGNSATVRLTYVVPSHQVWEGELAVTIPETTTVADLDIAWSDNEWRVVATRPSP